MKMRETPYFPLAPNWQFLTENYIQLWLPNGFCMSKQMIIIYQHQQ